MPATRATRRALVITTNFPPDAAVGTMRTLRLVRYLAQAEWDIDVVTIAPETLRRGTVLDPALLDRVPPAVYVATPGAWRPLERLAAALKSGRRAQPTASDASSPAQRSLSASAAARRTPLAAVRAALALPDREISWFLPAVAAGWRRARRHRPDVIYSSGPPFTAHLVGAVLASLLRRPWLVDFRDPWARAPWRDDRFAFEKRAWAVMERAVVRRADAAVFATETNRRDFAAQYGPQRAAGFHTVANGCDVTDFAGLMPSSRMAGDPFVLLHAGSLYGARNPAALLRAVRGLINRGALQPHRFRMTFVGRVGVPGLQDTVRRLKLDDVVEFVSHLPRREALQAMRNASALLIVQPVTTVSIPAKLYEYMAAGRPVLALAEPRGETAELVRASRAGLAVASDDEDAIARALVTLTRGELEPFSPVNPSVYDGAARARQLGDLLTRLASVPAGAALTAADSLTPADQAASREVTRA
jgi:glycosyltransferase involved in cell wall biosynthesis